MTLRGNRPRVVYHRVYFSKRRLNHKGRWGCRSAVRGDEGRRPGKQRLDLGGHGVHLPRVRALDPVGVRGGVVLAGPRRLEDAEDHLVHPQEVDRRPPPGIEDCELRERAWFRV